MNKQKKRREGKNHSYLFFVLVDMFVFFILIAQFRRGCGRRALLLVLVRCGEVCGHVERLINGIVELLLLLNILLLLVVLLVLAVDFCVGWH
jgi:hypothetical protein